MAEMVSASPKKPYKTPGLKIYGDIEVLTRTVSNTTKASDGGTGLTNKTN